MCGDVDESNQLLVDLIVGRKPCRFLIDTGAMISIMKPGISQNRMCRSDIVARGATGDEFVVFGLQKVCLTFLNKDTVYHDLVIADLKTSYDGLIGIDLMKKLGMRIDFTTDNVYIGDSTVSLNHELDSELLSVNTDELGPLTYSNGNNNTPTLGSSEITWNVVTCENHSIPPMTEVLVQGRLSVGAREEIVQTVLIEPMELSVHGLRTARVLSNVLEDPSGKSKQKFVVVKLINFSRERLEIHNNSLIGLAETFETEPTVSKCHFTDKNHTGEPWALPQKHVN